MTGEILSTFSELGEIINWAANHHEKLDGSGYPLHLNEHYLQLPDRIIAIADIFTALTEDRPYRPGMSRQQALQLIESDVINGARWIKTCTAFCITMPKRCTLLLLTRYTRNHRFFSGEAGVVTIKIINSSARKEYPVRIATMTNWAYGITVALTLAFRHRHADGLKCG
jgi:hypothetical protein